MNNETTPRRERKSNPLLNGELSLLFDKDVVSQYHEMRSKLEVKRYHYPEFFEKLYHIEEEYPELANLSLGDLEYILENI